MRTTRLATASAFQREPDADEERVRRRREGSALQRRYWHNPQPLQTFLSDDSRRHSCAREAICGCK